MKLRKSVNTASARNQKNRDKEEGGQNSDPEGACSLDVLSPVLGPNKQITVICEKGSHAFQDKLAIYFVFLTSQ